MDRRASSYPSRCMARRIRTVLVGSGLDERSDSVVAAGAALARAAGARLCLLHSAELDPHDAATGGWLDPVALDELAGARTEDLRRQAERLGLGAPLLQSLHVPFGAPERTLLQAASTLAADVVVVGATRGGRIWSRLLGSTTAALVRRAPCPVLVVRGELPIPPRRVLAPVDLSLLAGDSLRCGMHVLEQLEGHDVTTVEPLLVLRFLESDLAPQLRSDQIERLARAELGRFVDENATATGLHWEPKLRVGEAAAEILHELQETGADLAILGTHGLGGFVPGSTGSVAQAVVRRAPCSVMVVPPIAALDTAIAVAVQEQTAVL